MSSYIAEEHRNSVTRLEGREWQGTWHIDRQHTVLNNDNVTKINGLDVVTIVRNPYCRMLSFYNNFNKGKGNLSLNLGPIKTSTTIVIIIK